MVKDVSLVFSRVQPSIIHVCHVALVLNSESKPDQSVDDRATEAKDEEMLELDGDQRKRKLDLGGESHFMFFNQCVLECDYNRGKEMLRKQYQNFLREEFGYIYL